MTKIIATFDNFLNAKEDRQYFWFYDLADGTYSRSKEAIDFELMYIGTDPIMKDMFQFVNIRNIPVNVPYNIYIKSTYGNDASGKPVPNRNILQQIVSDNIIPLGYHHSQAYNDYRRVLNDSKNGLVDWYIDDVAEVFINEIAYWRDLQRKLGIPEKPHKLHILTGVYRNKAVEEVEHATGVIVHSANPFEKWSSHKTDYMGSSTTIEKTEVFLQQTINDIESKTVRPYRSLIYNRVPRPSRALLLENMRVSGSLQKSLYSWGIDFLRNQTENNSQKAKQFVLKESTNFSNTRVVYYYIDEAGRNKLEQIYDNWYGEHVQAVYFPDEIDKITLTQNQAHGTNLVHPRQCDFKIVTETVYSQFTFLTEKTFKAIRTLMPFVVFGNPETIRNLRALGYKTYDRWIDHSYDNVTEFTPRLDRLTKEIDRLSGISPEDWAEMRKEMLPEIIYNYQHLLTSYNRSYGHVWFE